MTRTEMQVLARIGAIEFLIENVYAVALMQCFDPVGEARRWAGQVTALARQARVATEVVDQRLAADLVNDMARELDAIFARILRRVESHAEAHPTAGEA